MSATDLHVELPSDTPAQVRDSLPRVFAASEFIARSCERDPALLADLIASGELVTERGAGEGATRHAPALPSDELAPEAQFAAALRHWRRREMVRIAWRDLAGWSNLAETLRELSALADAAIGLAYDYARRLLVERYGQPRSARGEAQPLVVIAMGKLGGGELNFSSDIDLVLLYPESGDTDGARPISNEEFFTRLTHALIRLLEQPTAEGLVFRVDLRLRPFGDSGPPVASFSSFEDYLQRHGRDWERYAWIKARPVTAAERYQEIYQAAVRPFVYRRYLDYGVFQSLREMKALIEREVTRRELADDVKLGPGGIREVEFIVQSLQLIRGGQDRRLRSPRLLEVLPLLDHRRLLSPQAVRTLSDAYSFLRRLENRLQMYADEQTHRIPQDHASRERLARAMGAADWRALASELDEHRARVGARFREVAFGGNEVPREASATGDLRGLFLTDLDRDSVRNALTELGFGAEADEALRLICELRDSALMRRLDESGRKRLQALLPALVRGSSAAASPLAVLKRLLRILEAIGSRSAYFALLLERPDARTRLIELAAHGDFLAEQIASYPLLLDELLDERLLAEPPSRAELAIELESLMEQRLEDEPERQVEALRHFQQAAMFRVAIADLTGRLPLMRVSDRLTDIAELIIERALDLAWQQMSVQYGVPCCGEGAERRAVRICAIGYGKLGGIELGYASDLDLVFLHDSAGEHQQTDAAHPIDNQLFFVRLGQRILHLLTMHCAAGRLYEVDVRLRPSGKGGMLVTSLAAFAEYQRSEAWTWEHQALLHARAVAGAAELRAAFERERIEVLRHHVRRESLREDVRAMRVRMRRELSHARPGQFDLKQDSGGVADIEFLAQYWALRWARDYPPVAQFSDTIRQLESVASAALVPQETVDLLTRTYRAYRASTHHLALQRRPAVVTAERFVAERAAVTAVWNSTLGD